MNETPEELKYASTHEWVLIKDDIATVGITHHAQSLLGDIVFVELPEMDAELGKGDESGVIESVKAASDLYNPVAGTVCEVNQQVSEQPELVNNSPYADGWLYKLKINPNSAEIDYLMSAEQYKKQLDDEEH